MALSKPKGFRRNDDLFLTNPYFHASWVPAQRLGVYSDFEFEPKIQFCLYLIISQRNPVHWANSDDQTEAKEKTHEPGKLEIYFSCLLIKIMLYLL